LFPSFEIVSVVFSDKILYAAPPTAQYIDRNM
jgi:hypothetical protein